MKVLRMSLLAMLVACISACGTGKFFIERTVTGLEGDIADEINDYAKFDAAQRESINIIARQSANWVKGDRLRLVSRELYNIASDVEQGATITRSTWDRAVAFIEQPLTMSRVVGLVERIADLCFGLSEEQAESVLRKMQKEHGKDAKQYAKQNLEDQNKKFARGLRIVFAEMGIKRSSLQMDIARQMLSQRQSHIDIEWEEDQRNHDVFVALIKDRSGSQEDYRQRFIGAWIKAEQGAKYRAPEIWQHNAEVAYGTMNFLLQDLTVEQRKEAAQNIYEYANLFASLANTR